MSRTRLGLPSLTHKLAGLFFAITAAMLAVVFFFIVPQLTPRLENQRLDDLERVAAASSRPLESVLNLSTISTRRLDGLVRSVADGANAKLTLLGQGTRNRELYPLSDSRAANSGPPRSVRRLASQALRTNRAAARITRVAGQRTAQVAVPLHTNGIKQADWVAVYSRSLGEVADTVSIIRRRVLIASGLALLVALFGGYAVARAVSRRVKRLENAADKVAAGQFVEPLPIDSRDELGQLTRSFNEMQEQLQKVERARREFIATASHELRTPIFSLGGFVELLQDEDLTAEERQEFLATMAEQVGRLQKLAVDLLDLSRIDAGSLELHSEDVDLGDIARRVVEEFAPAVTQHRSELALSLSDRAVHAWCDRERVAQVLRILLDNAIRHTPAGTPISVSAVGGNGSAALRVSDSGPGIADRDQVFERFYTADAARGSGLGLAIAQELAERMRGHVTLRSRPGETVFTLSLPSARNGGGA
ncbi:MAG: HAMP domain-containing histidine kinase [Thermoleophilaceae bacterium]|nr:HAMP domain-containing histidine kinase [Thermoleophilaceae bacterium]